MENSIYSSAGVIAALVTGASIASGPVDCDFFDDGVIDPHWAVVGSDLNVIAPIEQNNRLEFPADAVGPSDAFAGIASLWTLDAFQDFRDTQSKGRRCPSN